MEADPHRQTTEVVIANTKVHRTVKKKALTRDTGLDSGEGVGRGIADSTSVASHAGEGASRTSVRNGLRSGDSKVILALMPTGAGVKECAVRGGRLLYQDQHQAPPHR